MRTAKSIKTAPRRWDLQKAVNARQRPGPCFLRFGAALFIF